MAEKLSLVIEYRSQSKSRNNENKKGKKKKMNPIIAWTQK